MANRLSFQSLILLFFLIILVVDLEVPKFVGILRRSHDSKPISQIVLLQVLLRQVLEVSLTEDDVGRDDDLAFVPLDRDVVSKVIGLAFNLNPLVKILLLQNGNKTVYRLGSGLRHARPGYFVSDRSILSQG